MERDLARHTEPGRGIAGSWSHCLNVVTRADHTRAVARALGTLLWLVTILAIGMGCLSLFATKPKDEALDIAESGVCADFAAAYVVLLSL